jgi:hypothetical protein
MKFFGKSGAARQAGFSLVEVALALTVAAGGMAAIFGLFPAGLRQGVNANRDLVGASFAGSVLSAIAGNVRSIDDIRVWNNPEQWWKRAIANTDLPEWDKGKTPDAFREDSGVFAPNRSMVAKRGAKVSREEDNIRFFASNKVGERHINNAIALPAHYIIRVVRVRRSPRNKPSWEDVRGYVNSVDKYESLTESQAKQAFQKLRSPDRYLVSIVSSDQKGYAIFVNEPLYSQEYYFLPRP